VDRSDVPRKRPRLLPQPGRFAGVRRVGPNLQQGYLAVPHRVEVSHLLCHGGPADSSSAVVRGDDQHAIPQVVGLIDLKAVVPVERPEPVSEPLSDGLLANRGYSIDVPSQP
jgi:hypothetical protein